MLGPTSFQNPSKGLLKLYNEGAKLGQAGMAGAKMLGGGGAPAAAAGGGQSVMNMVGGQQAPKKGHCPTCGRKIESGLA